jgi:hypothetical protein
VSTVPDLFEVSLHVHSSGSVTSLRDVLQQSLPEVRDFERAPTIEVSGDDDPDLLVTIVLPADDASAAQQDARSALEQALTDVGVTGSTIDIRDDPDVQTS